MTLYIIKMAEPPTIFNLIRLLNRFIHLIDTCLVSSGQTPQQSAFHCCFSDGSSFVKKLHIKGDSFLSPHQRGFISISMSDQSFSADSSPQKPTFVEMFGNGDWSLSSTTEILDFQSVLIFSFLPLICHTLTLHSDHQYHQ